MVSLKGTRKYKDVTDAAEEAFKSATYAAAAARAAVELSRSESHDPADHNSSGSVTDEKNLKKFKILRKIFCEEPRIRIMLLDLGRFILFRGIILILKTKFMAMKRKKKPKRVEA